MGPGFCYSFFTVIPALACLAFCITALASMLAAVRLMGVSQCAPLMLMPPKTPCSEVFSCFEWWAGGAAGQASSRTCTRPAADDLTSTWMSLWALRRPATPALSTDWSKCEDCEGREGAIASNQTCTSFVGGRMRRAIHDHTMSFEAPATALFTTRVRRCETPLGKKVLVGDPI